MASWKSLTERAGYRSKARSVSVNQVYGSKNLDPYQNVTDLEHSPEALPALPVAYHLRPAASLVHPEAYPSRSAAYSAHPAAILVTKA
jgi:hypothetical protein